MRFSERHGFKPIKNLIQKESMDDDLRNKLWNALTMCYWKDIDKLYKHSYEHNFLKELWHSYFKQPTDTLGYNWYEIHRTLRSHFFNCEWYAVYDFIEFTANNFLKFGKINEDFISFCNSILKEELSAYRFVGHKITPITSEVEISTIEEALNKTNSKKPMNIHLQAAIHHLSDRKSPNYRNSIKESISAVEAFCNIVTGSPKTLGQGIKSLEKRIKFHPALMLAFDKLYGWTSEAEGIRHGLMKEPNLEFEDAKFMLVACSAFINFLMEKAAKAGINF